MADDWATVVEALYPYESTNARGHSVNIHPGELCFLIRDIDEDWWFVGRSLNDEDGFYFPRTYGKVMQRQVHRMSNKDVAIICPDPVPNLSASTNRLSTFGGGGGDNSGSLKRRSYQLATITDNQSAIYDNPVVMLNESPSMIADQSVETASQTANSLLRRKARGPGFKLADPNRISRSIPVDLNFVHHIPNGADQDARAVSMYGDSKSTGLTNLPENVPNGEEGGGEMIVVKPDQIVKPTIRTVIDGPIYANMRAIGKELPPLPVPGSSPINTLHDGWAEYVDKNNRHYFYNAKSKKAMWKPPRLNAPSGKPVVTAQSSVSSGDELDTSFVSDDGDAFPASRAPALSSSVTSAGESSLDWAAISSSSTCTGPSSASSPVPTVDIRALSNKKCTESSTNGETRPNRDSIGREVDVYACSEELANIATKLRSPTEEQPPPIEHSNSSLGRGLAFHGQPQQNFVRYGILSRCKYMEAGKRVKKQWLPCFVYLTNAHLIFYKDEKAAEKKGNQYPTPLGVCDLRGAKLRWLEGDVSRRKNVFQVQLVDSTVYLFHAENQPEISSWYDDLRQVIDQLPLPDFYPSPAIEPSSTRFSMRKVSTSKNTIAPEIPKLPAVVASPTKDVDKRKSVSFSQPPPPVSPFAAAPADMEQSIQKETILEKLRKFFRHRPSVETLKERGIYKPEPVFGSSLLEICRRENRTVPKFIVSCTALIEEKGLSADGLYRINGNLSQVQRIRCQVDQEKYSALMSETDVHVLTGALKLFFRELQEPAFPTSSTKEFLNAIKLQNPKQRWKAFSELVARLPRPHHDTLDHLFQHLLNVAKYSSKNRMQIHNLAIVFGPSLFSSNPSAKATMDLSKNKNKKKTAADGMKLKELEGHLGALKTFDRPKVKLEQYQTSTEIAAAMFHTMSFGNDIKGKVVADLGCGCGTLAIGASLLGANQCVGFDIDPVAVAISAENVESLELDNIDLITCDVTTIPYMVRENFKGVFDVVIMNPPFGTKNNEGIDVKFLRAAIDLGSSAIYSMHKTSTREYLMKVASQYGLKAEIFAQLRFDLPATMRFHKRRNVDIEVDLIRYEKIK